MSKPVTTTTKQTAAAVNSNNSASPKNAWAKGPPVNPVGQSSLPSSAVASPRSQSPNPQLPPTASHSRKSSGLGPGVAIKDGVSLPRSMAVAGHRQTPSINFGSIDSPSPVAPTNGHRGSQTADGQSSLPHPPLKPFGSVPISNPTSTPSITSSPSPANVAATSPTPSVASTAASSQQSVQPKKAKLDIHKMFQVNPQSQGAPAHSSPSLAPTSLPGPILSSPAVPSPQIRSSNLPQPAAHSPYIPPQSQSSHLRAHQSQPAPRSPQMARNNLAQGPTGPQMPNRGSVITPVPQLPQSSGPAGAQLSSPRLGHQLPAHHQPPQPPPQTPQHQVPPQMHVPIHPQPWQGYYQPYYHPQDYSMSAPAAYWQQPGPPHAPYLPPHQHPHHQPPNSMPHSPRHGPMSTLPPNNGPPSAATTPINTAIANSPAPSSSRLSSTPLTPRAPEFIPSGKKQIRITNASGEAVTFRPPDSISRDEKKEARKSTPIRLESEDDRRKRVAEEEARKRAEEEEVRKVEEDKKRAVEEQLKREREAEAKRIRLEEEEKQRQEQERLKKEEEDRIKVEKERRKIEEEERLKKEEEERLVREEEERKARDAEEKRRLEEQEQERLRKEAEEARLQKEAEENAKKEAERLAEEALVKKEKERIELEEKRRNDERIKDSSAMTVSPKLVAVVPSAKPALHPLNTLNGDKPRRPVPGPLDLSNTNKPGMPAPLPSALATARIIDDLDSIHYPPGIKTPDTELNQGNTKGGKFKYDRDFLLQFMSICKDKPDSLPPLDALGIEKEEGGSSNLSAYGSQGRAAGRRQAGSMGPPMSRSASLGIGNPSLSARGGLGGPMGNFSTPSAKLPSASGTSSEERFAASNAMRSASAAFVGGRPTPMVRTSSQGGIGSRDGGPASPRENQRTRSQRGRQRNDSLKPNNAAAAQAAVSSSLAHGLSNLGLEPVVPLQATENRWVPVSKVGKGAVETDSPETVDRKVKALLNKLTMEKFESISNQIIAWANKSETEKDGRTLIQVIRLVFEKATDEATWSEMYARLCRKMMEQISQNVQDDGIRNTEGNPITGGQLFRKYLLNRCQEDFERGWSMKESTAAAAAAKAHEDKAVAEDAAKKQKDGKEEEVELYSEEYYAALKAKRQGLGLVKFIGELFKLSMLTERIMHECIKKLLSNVDDPEEEEIESLCKLLTTVGQSLDTVKAKGHMDIYFSRMSELAKNEKLTSRVRYMLQDVIELRHRNWLPRSTVAVPQTRSQIQEATAKERAAQEKELARLPSMSRGGSRRGEGNRGDFNQNAADGWNVAGGGNQARPAPKAGDLSNFGKITKSGGMMNLGPSSVFKKEGKGRDTPQSLSRTASSSNMFSMLSSGAGDAPIEPPPVTGRTQSNRGSSRKSSVDMSATNTLAPDTPVRKKIQLLPRTVGVSTAPPDEKDESGQQSASEDEDEEPSSSQKPVMSEERAKAKIDEDIKEFFALKKIDEAENYFHDLPEEHRHLLVDKLVARAFDGKEAEVELVADLFSRASVTSGCSAESFEKGLFPTIEYLDDIAIDVPHAYVSMAKLLKGTSLSRSAVEVLATRIIVDGEPLVSPKDKLLKEFNKLEA